MALNVKPKPCGPLLIMIGGFRELTNGEISLEGEASLDEAVLEPPGDWIGWGMESSVIPKNIQKINIKLLQNKIYFKYI